MTTFFEFLAGNALALGVVGLVAILAAAVFAFGGDREHAPYPTRPVTDRAGLAESTEPVAVVGTPTIGTPDSGTPDVGTPDNDTPDANKTLEAPFTGEDVLAFQVDVSGALGHVATLRAGREFDLDVDGERVTVAAGPTPVVDDDRESARVRVDADELDDVDATARESLDAFDAERAAPARLLSGSVLPTGSRRTYHVRAVDPGEDVAAVGYLRESATGGWTLEAPENVRLLDPDDVRKRD